MKSLRSSAVFFLLLSLLSTPAFTADLLTVYELALENDNVLKAAHNENLAVYQVQRQKKGLYYPSLDLGYDHIQTNQVINRSENEVFGSGESDFDTDVLSLSLTQPIFRLGFFRQRKVAKAEVSQADYQLADAEQELILRSAEAYLLSLAAEDNVRVTRTEGEVFEQQLKLTSKRLDVGLAHPAEVYESRARVDFNLSELIAAENEVVNQAEGLRVITGVAVDNLSSLKEDILMVPPDPADQDKWIEMALENNLSMKALESALEVAAAEHKSIKSGFYPSIDFVANFNNRDSGGSLFGGGSDVDTTDLMLRGKWNLLQGGITHARVKEAFYLKQRAEDELELKRATVRRETRNAYLGVVSSIAKAKALKSSMESQAYTAKAKRKGFETGTIPNIQVLDAERDFFFVQRDYLKARYQYFLNLLQLKLQVGSLSPADLKMINSMLKADSGANVSAAPAAVSYPLAGAPEAAATSEANSPSASSDASSDDTIAVPVVAIEVDENETLAAPAVATEVDENETLAAPAVATEVDENETLAAPAAAPEVDEKEALVAPAAAPEVDEKETLAASSVGDESDLEMLPSPVIDEAPGEQG